MKHALHPSEKWIQWDGAILQWHWSCSWILLRRCWGGLDLQQIDQYNEWGCRHYPWRHGGGPPLPRCWILTLRWTSASVRADICSLASTHSSSTLAVTTFVVWLRSDADSERDWSWSVSNRCHTLATWPKQTTTLARVQLSLEEVDAE